MTNLERILIVMFVCLFSNGFSAEDSFSDELPSRPLSVAELVDRALSRHPSTQRTWWNAQRAAAAIGSEESHYYPQINAIGEVRLGEECPKNSPETKTSTQDAHLALDLLLFDFGARDAAVAAAKESLHQASWETDWNVQKVLLDVCDASYAVLHAQEVCEATLLSLSEAEKMCDAAEELNRAGLKPVYDVYTSRASVSRARMEQSAQKAALLTCKARLAVNIGEQATKPLSLAPIDNKALSLKKQAIDEMLKQANAQRADLQAKRAEYQATVFDAKKEERVLWPTLSLFGEAGVDRTTTRHVDEPPYPRATTSRRKNYSGGIRLSIPVFTGFLDIYRKRQAYATANHTQAELAELQNEISFDVASSCYSLEAAQEMLPNAQETLDNAIKAYESAFERYTLGEGTMVELSEAQEEVFSARIRYSDVKKEWLSAIAKVAYATGTQP